MTEATTEAFNILLPLLGAIVTDNGGLLSHSAIVAREYGIPGVVGTAGGDRTHRRRDAGARRRRRRRSDRARREGGRPARQGARHRDLRVEGGRAGRAPSGRASRSRPGVALVRLDRRGRRRGGRARHREGWPRRSGPCAVPLAVRSSAVDEDGAEASFAGQHLTLLNVPSVDELPSALREIWWSANSDSAITYRQRVGLFTRPSVGVVVQTLLDPDVAGVMFTAESDHRGRRAGHRGQLGAGRGRGRRPGHPRPLPDRPLRSGARAQAGTQDASRSAPWPAGARSRRRSRPSWSSSSASTTTSSSELSQLASRCEQVYGPARDIEWAFADGTLYLLQCRAVTTGRPTEQDSVGPGGRRPRRGPPARAALRRARPEGGRADRPPVQGAPLRQGRDRGHGGLGRRRLLPDRLRARRRCRSAGTEQADPAAGRLLRRDRADRRGPALGDDHRHRANSSATGSPSGSSARSCRGTVSSAGSCCSRWRRSSRAAQQE